MERDHKGVKHVRDDDIKRNLSYRNINFRYLLNLEAGIKIRYGLDGQGFEPRRGQGVSFYHAHPDRPWGPPSPI
jgi:hypothetical protein